MYNNEQKTTLLIHEQKMKPFFLGHNYLKVVLLGSVRFTLPQQNVTTGVDLSNQLAQTLKCLGHHHLKAMFFGNGQNIILRSFRDI